MGVLPGEILVDSEKPVAVVEGRREVKAFVGEQEPLLPEVVWPLAGHNPAVE